MAEAKQSTTAALLKELREMGEFIPMHQSTRYATLLSKLEHAIKVERETSNQDTKEQLESAQTALENEARLRIKDCENRNAYKRRADIAEAALREIDAMRTKPHDNTVAAYAEVCEIARKAVAYPASRPNE